jgi:hypothetical protein
MANIETEYQRAQLILVNAKPHADQIIKGCDETLRITIFFSEQASNAAFYSLTSKICDSALSHGFNTVVIYKGNNQDGCYLHGIAVKTPNFLH